MGKYSTPRVPIQTPMFDANGQVTRAWIIFWERLGLRAEEAALQAGARGPYIRVLLLKNLTVGDDIAEHEYIFLPPGAESGTGRRIVAVLKEPITADLVVRFNNLTPATPEVIATVTIPLATDPADPPLEFDISDKTFNDLDVISADITASDGSV